MVPSFTQQERVLQQLRSSSVHIQDFRVILKGWSCKTNPNLARLRGDMTVWIEKTYTGTDSTKRLHRMDFALFGSLWWPHAAYDRLFTATKFIAWLFVWDDKTDSKHASMLSESWEQGQSFRKTTLEYIHACLGFPNSLQLQDEHLTPLITGFASIGEAFNEISTAEQRELLVRELELFVDMTEVEQRLFLDGELPSLEEYWACRRGTSAVGACLVMSEYCLETPLPPFVWQDEDFVCVREQTNIIISYINDILSLKKEVKQGQVGTLVPILLSECGDVQVAVDAATDLIRESVEMFDHAAEALINKHCRDSNTATELARFVEACRNACTCVLEWTLASSRYGLEQDPKTTSFVMHL